MSDKQANPVLWLVIGLPAAAVVASFATLIVSTRAADQPLPTRYHWEGEAYDADQARVNKARQVGVRAQIHYDAQAKQCEVVLSAAAPDALRMDLAHPTDQSLDRHLKLARTATGYRAACEPLPLANWWIEVADDSAGWALRGRLRSDFAGMEPLLP